MTRKHDVCTTNFSEANKHVAKEIDEFGAAEKRVGMAPTRGNAQEWNALIPEPVWTIQNIYCKMRNAKDKYAQFRLSDYMSKKSRYRLRYGQCSPCHAVLAQSQRKASATS